MTKSRNRGSGKNSISQLSRKTPTKEELDAVSRAVFENTSPIVTAILGVAVIEHELEILLRTRITRKDEATWKLLTEERGPFGSFSAKITAGYAFKFFDEDFRENLNIVRRIRNQFAHAKHLFGFDHELIVSEIEQVRLPENRRNKNFKTLNKVRSAKPSARGAFISLCFHLATQLVARDSKRLAARIRSLKRPKHVTLPTPGSFLWGGSYPSPVAGAIVGAGTKALSWEPQTESPTPVTVVLTPGWPTQKKSEDDDSGGKK